MKFDLYDFDGTIYDGDSGVDLVKFAIKRYPKFLKKVPKLLFYALLYLLKLRTKEQMKSDIFSFMKYVDDVDVFVADFWKEHEHKIKDFWLQKKSHKKDIIISASGYFWLKPIAEKYKVYDLIATTVDDRTGEVVGKNCHGKEKVRLFKEKYPRAVVLEMYTDSVNDLPLIEIADTGILVKGDNLYNYYNYRPNFIVRFWRWGWGIYHRNEEVWNYIIVGALTTLINIGIKYALYFTVLDVNKPLEAQIAVAVSWICAVLFAYVFNRIYVFKSKSKKILKQMCSFIGARILTYFMEVILTYIFFNHLGLTSKNWIIIVTIGIQLIIMLLNYIFSKLFVFKK